MDEETKQHIFEPFYSATKSEKGTGLGLATVYGIVKQNDGNIYVESEPDEGSVFNIYWPATAEQTVTESKIESDVIFQPRSESILFVEDDIHLRSLMSNALRHFGYEVVEAEDGVKALEIVKNNSLAHKIDLVISDIIMPEMGGEELAEQLRQLNPKIKILLSSGFTDSRISSQDVHTRNSYYFIAKPYGIKKLEKSIRSILSKTG
jgi:two-component system cell cycle sensor histidine kinase/response regulator CckA